MKTFRVHYWNVTGLYTYVVSLDFEAPDRKSAIKMFKKEHKLKHNEVYDCWELE